MKPRFFEKFHGLLPVLLAGVWLTVFWGDLIVNAHERMLTQGGIDGIKNYYTLSWYLDHNTSWTEFEGMNHPDGDLIVYTDNHPLLAVLLRWMGVPGNRAVGWLNLCMLLALIPATWLTWDVFRKLKVPDAPASFMALAVCVLLPQWERMGGHFSLSHMWAVPAMVWLLQRHFLYGPNPWNSASFALLSLGLFFIHPYLGLMAAGLAIGSGATAWWLNRKSKPSEGWIAWSLIQGLLPIACFQCAVWWVDAHVNRPTDPWGFWSFNSTIPSWLVPYHGPLARVFSGPLRELNVPWEIRAYIGFAALVLLVAWLIRCAQKRESVRTPFAFKPLVGGGALLALFALSWVFELAPPLVDEITPLKNFRVLGRFAWPGVFILNAALLSWGWRRTEGQRIWRLALVAAIGFGVWESGDWHHVLASSREGQVNLFHDNQSAPLQDVLSMSEKAECQGILPVPYFYKGSETWDTDADEKLVEGSMLASFHSGLPLLASLMSRTSVTEAREHLSICTPFPYEKSLLDEVEGPLLLVAQAESLDSTEAWLLDQCNPRLEARGLRWGVLSLASLRNQPLVIGDAPLVHLHHEGVVFKRDSLAATSSPKEFEVLADFEPGRLMKGTEYACSVWYTQNEDNRPREALFIEEITPEKTSWLSYHTLNYNAHFSGDSIRSSIRFQPNREDARYRLMLRRPKRDLDNVSLKCMMVRPTDVNVVDTLHGGLYSVNNHVRCSRVIPFNP